MQSTFNDTDTPMPVLNMTYNKHLLTLGKSGKKGTLPKISKLWNSSMKKNEWDNATKSALGKLQVVVVNSPKLHEYI